MRSPSMIRQASLASGRPTALETNGTVRDARGLASITYSSPPCDGVLHVEQPDDAERERDLARGGADLLEHLLAERVRRQHAGAVAGVHAGLLDVLHDAADPDVAAVAQGVDVDLGGVLEKAVQKDGRRALRALSVGRVVTGPGERRGGGAGAAAADLAAQVVGEAVVGVDDLHGAAAEHVGGAHDQREADEVGALERFLQRAGGGVGRRLVAEAVEQRAEARAVLGEVDRIDAGAEQRHARVDEAGCELQRRLPAELHDHPRAACSTSTTASTSSSVSGSKYRRSEVS